MQEIVIKIKNVENRINELKSELSIVWDNAYSFNSGYTSLKTCLYKATNAKYYNRLIDNNNEELLKERDIYLKSIDLIIENIKLIDAYYSLYDELRNQIKEGNADEELQRNQGWCAGRADPAR